MEGLYSHDAQVLRKADDGMKESEGKVGNLRKRENNL